jgi:type I restriction enzyme S subunit
MSEWIEKPLDEVAEIISGGTPSRDIGAYWGGGIPWVTPTDITACSSNTLEVTEDTITKLGLLNSSAKLLPPGSILLTSRASIGLSKIAGVAVCTNQGFKSLVPKQGVNGKFLFYQTQRLRSAFERYAAGSTFLEINKKDTARIPIPHPSAIAEQLKIAEVLTAIDTAIEKTEALIAKHQQIKAGLMHDLFTRGVLPNGQLRPPREQAPELYQDTPLGWLPKEWKQTSMVELADDRSGSTTIGPFGSNLVASDYREDGVPVVFVRDVKEAGFQWNSDTYVSAAKAQHLAAHTVSPGDVLATKMGLPPCVSCVYPEWMPAGVITADMIRLSPNKQKVVASWLAMAINQDRVRRQVAAITAGVTRPKVTLADFRKLKVAKPELDEQIRIKDKLGLMQEKIDRELAKQAKLSTEKLGLMQDLLTGKVSVPAEN